MYKRILRKRILRGLVISLALVAVIPVTSAAAKPVSVGQPDPWLSTLLANQRYQQNQIGVSGQELKAMVARGDALNRKYNLGQYAFGPTKQELAAMNARGEGMNKKYQLGQYAVNSEISTGLDVQPPRQTPVASGGDFEWGSTGIGVGLAALLIAGTGAVLFARNRQQGTLAH